MKTSRRNFLLLGAAAASHGCVSRGAPIARGPAPLITVRAPEVNQSWRYAQYEHFTGKRVDTSIDRVTAVGRAIAVASRSETQENDPIKYPSWGAAWREKYLDGVVSSSSFPGPNELQQPWGTVLLDPHWTQLQAYENPIPLWPAELRPGWSTTVFTYYKVPDIDDRMPWQLTMQAQGWESITVPAGTFRTLHFYNVIDFRYSNASEREAAQRFEHVWLAPELGRWVRRESRGIFRESVGYEVKESSYRWELLEWT